MVQNTATTLLKMSETASWPCLEKKKKKKALQNSLQLGMGVTEKGKLRHRPDMRRILNNVSGWITF